MEDAFMEERTPVAAASVFFLARSPLALSFVLSIPGCVHVLLSLRPLRMLLVLWLVQITDEGILELARFRGGQLRAISLSKCGKTTDRGVQGLAELSPNLETVNLNECFRITSAGVIVRRGFSFISFFHRSAHSV